MDSNSATIKTKPIITVEATIKASGKTVWEYWTLPEHIIHWNFAGDDWHCPSAVNDLKPEGRFSWRMEAKDGSFGFDFSGTYKEVITYQRITNLLDDNRSVHINFIEQGGETKIVESFEAEGENALELQQQGWQMILNNFKKYAETSKRPPLL